MPGEAHVILRPFQVKSQIQFFTSLTGVLIGRKNKRDIFYPARTSVLIKNLSKLDI